MQSSSLTSPTRVRISPVRCAPLCSALHRCRVPAPGYTFPLLHTTRILISGRLHSSNSISSITSVFGFSSTSSPCGQGRMHVCRPPTSRKSRRNLLYRSHEILQRILHQLACDMLRRIRSINLLFQVIRGSCSPSCSVAIYSLVWYWNSSIRLVAFPVQIIMTPVASGSSVPACPTFIFFTPSLRLIWYLTLFTSANDVHRSGLSKYNTSPSLKFIRLCLWDSKLVTIVMIPTMAQYTPNQISLPFFTILIIHLHAIHPETKAARKPTTSDAVLMPALYRRSILYNLHSIQQSLAQNRRYHHQDRENCASVSFCYPDQTGSDRTSQRDSPWHYRTSLRQSDNKRIPHADTFLLSRFRIIRESQQYSRCQEHAIPQSAVPSRKSLHIILKEHPTMPIGSSTPRCSIIFCFLVQLPFKQPAEYPVYFLPQDNQRTFSTVATCTTMVNVRFSPSMPNSADPIARCPLLLTGRYSVSPTEYLKLKLLSSSFSWIIVVILNTFRFAQYTVNHENKSQGSKPAVLPWYDVHWKYQARKSFPVEPGPVISRKPMIITTIPAASGMKFVLSKAKFFCPYWKEKLIG